MYNFFSSFLVYILPAATIVMIVLYIRRWFIIEGSRFKLDPPPERRPQTLFPQPHRMARVDVLLLLLITAVYSVVAFTGLGDKTNPQTFYRFTSKSSQLTLDLGGEHYIDKIVYYTGNWHNDDGYKVSFSADNRDWTEPVVMEQTHATTYHWMMLEVEGQTVRYVRIRALSTPMELGEISFYNGGEYIPSETFAVTGEALKLFDEQDIIPPYSTYLNSAYFDEIYHARTAYEFLEGMRPYETTHPPLGKVFISIGIALFGMTPFGWRFSGVVFGILMAPIIYIFLKKFFGKTAVATMGTLLFAFDFMHFVQTRISTIDTYGVFFTILMYFFMYLFVSSKYDGPLHKQLVPLALCGISFGLGAASKWTCFYAAFGLVALYLIYIIRHFVLFKREERLGEYFARLSIILLTSVIFFIAAAGAIYYFSYWFYAKGMNEPLSLKMVWASQLDMFDYHKNVTATHPYQSSWWMWLFNARPILYFRQGFNTGVSSFAAWLNPVVCWTGLLAILSMGYHLIRRRADGRALFIVIGFLSQLVSWIPITRCTFAYHYFPSMVFLVFSIAYVMDRIIDIAPERKNMSYALTGGGLGLFALFYPVLTGVIAPQWYYDFFLKWFPSWPF